MVCEWGEKKVEAYLGKGIKALGGKAYKFISPGNKGMPDRFIGLPGGRAFFVETKSPGEKPDAKQRARHRELRKLGFAVFGCVDSREDVEWILEWVRSGYSFFDDLSRLREMEFFDHE